LIADHDYDGNDINEKKLDSIDIVRANVVSEDGGNSRLVLKSASSGYSYRMGFTDSADSFLSGLEVSNNSQMSGISGGFINNIGTGVTDSLLNSKFIVNGLTFYRDTNNITDALTGVTLDLLNTFTTPQTVTVSADVDGVKKEVQDFLDAFNGSIDYLRTNAEMNPVTKERGVLADDGLYRQMTSTLRSKLNTIVSNTASSTYDRLFDLGIESDTTGHYSIVDSSKFKLALESSTKNVSDLFNATDGIATLVKTYVNSFVKVGGSIDSSKNTLQDSIPLLQMN
jgi:flagellar hook-associated protein 2